MNFYLKCKIGVGLLCYFCLLSAHVYSQNIEIKIEAQKIKYLLAQAESSYSRYPEKAASSANQALQMGIESQNIPAQLYALSILGRTMEKMGDQALALRYFTSAVALRHQIDEQPIDAGLMFFIGYSLRYLKRFDEAISYINKGIDKKILEDDDNYLMQAYDLLSSFYKGKKRYQESLDSSLLSLEHAKKINSDDYILIAYRNIAHSAKKMEDHELSIKYNNMALKIVEKNGNLAKIAQYLEYLSTDQRALGYFSEALQTAKRALSVQRELKNDYRISNLLLNISIIYLKLSSYDKSLEYALELFSMHENKNNINRLASACNQLAQVYFRLKKITDAVYYYELTLGLDSAQLDPKYRAAAFRGLSGIKKQEGSYTQGLIYAEKAEVIYSEINNLTGIASSLRARAELYKRLDEKEKALNLLERSLLLETELSNRWGEASSWIHIGELLYDDDIDRARVSFLKGLDIANDLNAKSLQLNSHLGLNYLERHDGNSKKALYHFDKVFELIQKINTDTINERIVELQILQETEKKEREIEELKRISMISELELEKQTTQLNLLNKENTISALRLEQERYGRFFLIAITTITIIGMILLYRRYCYIRTLQSMLSERHAEIEEKNKTLEELNLTKDRFFSIISHDLRGPISSLSSLSSLLKEKLETSSIDQLRLYVDTINDASIDTHNLLNDLLEWAVLQLRDTDPIPGLHGVADICDNAVKNLEASANLKDIYIDVRIREDSMAFADKNMMLTILRNLIANAIKFTPQGGTIHIYTEVENDMCVVHVKDFGVGIVKDDKEKLFKIDKVVSRKGTEGEVGTGFGLALCKDLVEKNGGRLNLVSEVGEGSDFYFSLPLNNT